MSFTDIFSPIRFSPKPDPQNLTGINLPNPPVVDYPAAALGSFDANRNYVESGRGEDQIVVESKGYTFEVNNPPKRLSAVVLELDTPPSLRFRKIFLHFEVVPVAGQTYLFRGRVNFVRAGKPVLSLPVAISNAVQASNPPYNSIEFSAFDSSILGGDGGIRAWFPADGTGGVRSTALQPVRLSVAADKVQFETAGLDTSTATPGALKWRAVLYVLSSNTEF